jgi:glycosyltransferase involved in cell wall biosynthesis
MKKILMVVFHYPPVQGSSGVHRALNFSRYLPEYGWQPIVLTVTAEAHPAVEAGQYTRIPPNVPVERAFALDSARHLSLWGVFPRWLAIPDRWISWYPSAVVKGIQLIRRHRPQVIWSTFPIATAHLIALTLHRLSGVPWVADFRDPMTEKDPRTGQQFPLDATVRRANGWIERPAMKHCARAVFTTPGTAGMYAERFVEVPQSRLAVIANGYDEDSFEKAQSKLGARRPPDGRIELLHSGALYPDARDPRCFFEALARLRASGEIAPSTLKIVLRGSGYERLYRSYLKDYGIADVVSLEGQIPYEQALAEMLSTDGLLIFQASNCNWQIPAKLYEYLRAQRPILAFTDPAGDTAKLLQSEGIETIVPLDSKERIEQGLRDFVRAIREGRAGLPSAAGVKRHSRRLRTGELATLLDSVADQKGRYAPCIGYR